MGNSLQKSRENLQNPLLVTQEEDANASFTCEICFEPMSSNKRFKNNNCAHPLCLDCIADYLEFSIEDHTASIPCPDLNCQQLLDPLSCRALISPSVFSEWCDLLCDYYVLGFERSDCPNRNCRELVVNECGGTVMKSKCPNCKELFCFECKSAWHAGYGCEENRNMMDPNDILFGKLMERKRWTRCPRCGQCIERNKGCSVIKCRCKIRFCYNCGKEFSSNGCKCNLDDPDQMSFYTFITLLILTAVLLVPLYYICKLIDK